MGHAYEHVLMDTLNRRRLRGYEVLWLPGMDHATIAMQTMVERKLADEGKTRDDLGRDAFIERVWREKDISGTIGDQMARGRQRRLVARRHDGRGLSRGPHHLQTALRRRADLPGRAPGELVADVEDRGQRDIEVKYADVDGELVFLPDTDR